MNFRLAFDLQLEGTTSDAHLQADGRVDISRMIYHLTNIGIRRHAHVFPDISIRKRNESWIHMDSGHESRLSRAAGMAIEKLRLFRARR